MTAETFNRGILALRDGFAVVGVLVLLTAAVGGVRLVQYDWKLFCSGGIWIGAPLAVIAYSYGARHDR